MLDKKMIVLCWQSTVFGFSAQESRTPRKMPRLRMNAHEAKQKLRGFKPHLFRD
jgi:hypothetical protein